MSIRDDADGAAMGFRSSDNIAKWQGSQPAMSIKATQPEDSEDVLWSLLNAVCDEMNRKAIPGPWLSMAYAAGSAFITKRRPAETYPNAKPPMRHISGVNVGVLERAARAALATPSPQPAEAKTAAVDGMTDEQIEALLPDPEEKTESWRDEYGYEKWDYAFSEAQMKAYGLQCYQLAMERAAQACESGAADHREMPDDQIERAWKDCAAAIRALALQEKTDV